MTNKDPAWIRLRAAAQEDGLDVAALEEMLWLANLHPELPGFVRICSHGAEMAALNRTTVFSSLSADVLDRWTSIFDWVIGNAVPLSERLFPLTEEDAESAQKRFLGTGRSNPILGQGVKWYGLHSAWWNDHEEPGFRPRYRLLQRYLLLAHIQLLWRTSNQQHWRDGTEPYPGFHSAIYTAAWALRSFASSDSDWSSAFGRIDFEETCLDETGNGFSDGLRELADTLTIRGGRPERGDDTGAGTPLQGAALNSRSRNLPERALRSLAHFLDWGHDRPNRRKRTGIGGKGNPRGAGRRIDGAADANTTEANAGKTGGSKFAISSEELIQPDLSSAIVYFPRQWSGNPAQRETANMVGDHPAEEHASNTLLLAEEPAAAAMATGGAVEMANQLLPFSYGNLALREVANLLCAVQARKDRVEWLEVSALLHTMLWTGATIEEALQLEVQMQNIASDTSRFMLILDDEELKGKAEFADSPQWHRPIRIPEGSEQKLSSQECVPQSMSYIRLPDLIGGSSPVLRWWSHLRSVQRSRANTNAQDPCTRLFRREMGWYRERLELLRSDDRSALRLPVSKINGVLFQTIVEQTNGDLVAAAWITGTDHRLASVRRFYRAAEIAYLQQIYDRATRSIADTLSSSGYQGLTSTPHFFAAPAVRMPAASVIGSRYCPKLETVRAAVLRLKADIEQCAECDEETETLNVRLHNCYTLFSLWSFGFAIGARGVCTPYLDLGQVDRSTGMARMRDKGPESGYKTRALWIPPTVQRQMVLYDTYLRVLHAVHDLPAPSSELPCYLLADTGKVVKVQPRSLAPLMTDYLAFPVNLARHFVASHLRQRGLAPEMADAWLGHWWRGEEPWGPFSAFSYSEYKRQLQHYLVPFLKELGFESIALIAPGDETA